MYSIGSESSSWRVNIKRFDSDWSFIHIICVNVNVANVSSRIPICSYLVWMPSVRICSVNFHENKRVRVRLS